MFKIPEFKKHFIYLLIIGLVFFILAVCSLFFVFLFDSYNNILSTVVFIILTAIPIFCLTGYFWCLTENIINREDLVVASSIFNGKIGTIKNIKLPQFDFIKFVWRGIASIFATIILYFPLVYVCARLFNDLSGLTSNDILFFGVIIFIISFVPALLWNYARRDSVLAVLNIPKAVYIMGTYTGRYIINTALFIIYFAIYTSILSVISIVFGLSVLAMPMHLDSMHSVIVPIPLFIFTVFCYVTSIYWLYVNAFLLGTLTPTNEV